MPTLRAHAAELIRRAILTMAVSPDRERRFLAGYRNSMPEPLREAWAYGYHAPRARRFQPRRRDFDTMLEVLSWLAWLYGENDGPRDVKIITARAFGTPTWKLAQRFGRSDKTIHRWESGAIAKIALRFAADVERLYEHRA